MVSCGAAAVRSSESTPSENALVVEGHATSARIAETIAETLGFQRIILPKSQARSGASDPSEYDLRVRARSDRSYHERTAHGQPIFAPRGLTRAVLMRGPDEYEEHTQIANTPGFAYTVTERTPVNDSATGTWERHRWNACVTRHIFRTYTPTTVHTV